MSDRLPAVVPEQLSPGLVPVGFSESLLERVTTVDDPRMLYDAAAHFAGLAQKWNGHGKEKTEIKSAQMYCEVRLGQVLGPNPGDAAKGPSKSPHADFELPKQRIQDFRRFYGHFDELVEAIRNGKRSRRSLLLLVDQWEAEIHRDISLRNIVTVTDMLTGTERQMTPREFFLWMASREDERFRGDDWMFRQFIKSNRSETLAVEGDQWRD